MGDDRISNNDAIDAALRLDGDPQKLREFYDSWARRYEDDVGAMAYSTPTIAVRLLLRYLSTDAARLLDAGCGTGLVGVELAAQGYVDIDGFDISESMAVRAVATGCYRKLRGGVDIMQAAQDYTAEAYDAVLSIGVFTPGHVPPQALAVLLQLVHPGGLLLVSTRTHYYETTEFGNIVEDLRAGGSIELLELLQNAPYNSDGDAHYWVFRKPA